MTTLSRDFRTLYFWIIGLQSLKFAYADKIIAVGYVNTPKCLIVPGCAFKVSENPLKFTVSVRVIITVSAQSITTLYTLILCR